MGILYGTPMFGGLGGRGVAGVQKLGKQWMVHSALRDRLFILGLLQMRWCFLTLPLKILSCF